MVYCGSIPHFPQKKNMLNTLLQIMSDSSVVISTMPHPVSMFFLALGFAINFYLFMQQRSLKEDYIESKKQEEKLKDKIQDLERSFDKQINEVSRKVDSRVDKALKKN
jgi:hypothetical protein